MPKWNDFGNIWATLRELDVNTIRDEAERPLSVVCVGHGSALQAIADMLHSGNDRYGLPVPDALELIDLAQAPAASSRVMQANLLLLAIDARSSLSPNEAASFRDLERLAIPFLVVILFGEHASGAELPRSTASIAIPDPAALDAPDRLASAITLWLPEDLQLVSARRLPGMRPTYSRTLIGSTSFANATYALASGLPEQIPIMSVPFAAADILVLTKNQAMLVYRLALAHGAPPDFQARIREVLPVIGGAFLWRQAARSLIGLIPVWGLLPKVAIAYAGTYTTGVAAWRWFDSGELISTDQIRRISQEALAMGRQRAAELIGRARQSRARPADPMARPGLLTRARNRLPWRRSNDKGTPE